MSVIDDIIKALQGKKTPQETSLLIDQIIRERTLLDAFKKAGLTPTLDDLEARSKIRPEGIMTFLEKINLIDLIEKINLIALISEITHIGTIDTITSVGNILTLDRIAQIDRLNPLSAEAFVNKGFETGDATGWTYGNTTGVISSEFHSGAYCFQLDSGVGQGRFLKQLFNPPYRRKRDVQTFECYVRGKHMVNGANDSFRIYYNGGLLSGSEMIGGFNYPTGWLLNPLKLANWSSLPNDATIEGILIEPATIEGYGNYYDDFTCYDPIIKNVIVDLVDRCNTYGSLSLLQQRDTTFDLLVQLRNAGVEIDPRDISDRVARKLGEVSLGNLTGKTNVLQTGNLVTTTTTADQVILTYTVTTGKTFYLEYITATARLTTYAVTATLFGQTSLENPSGTKLITTDIAHAGVVNPPFHVFFSEPIPIPSGTVIRIVCTPNATTSMTWKANFGGYEK